MVTGFQPGNTGRKAITPKCSISSLSTAYSTEKFMGPTIDSATQQEDNLRTDQQCWRPHEMRELFRKGDKISILRFCKFGLMHDQYAKFKGLPIFFSHQNEQISFAKHWELDNLLQIFGDDPAAVAETLSRRSVKKLTSIPFEDLTRKAYGIASDCVESVFFSYDVLCLQLYNKLVRAPPDQHDFLPRLLKNLKDSQSDPFIVDTIEHTWEKLLARGQHESLELMQKLQQKLEISLDRVIINPLKQLLERPSAARHILEELEVLRLRFSDFYNCSTVNWGLAFDTSIWLLDHLRSKKRISAFAEYVTKEDYALFSIYIRVHFGKDGDPPKKQRPAQSPLVRRWSAFSTEVKHCLAARVDVASQVDLLAEAFYRRRNYYSLTAIIHAAISCGLETDTAKKFGILMDEKFYRGNINHRNEDTLHHLSHAMFDFAKGETALAENVILAAESYTAETQYLSSQMKFKPLESAVKGNGGSHQHESSSYWLLFAKPIFTCFGIQ